MRPRDGSELAQPERIAEILDLPVAFSFRPENGLAAQYRDQRLPRAPGIKGGQHHPFAMDHDGAQLFFVHAVHVDANGAAAQIRCGLNTV